MRHRFTVALSRLLLTATLVLTAGVAFAEGIGQGPYLQNPTTSGITVCWVSGSETTGLVRFGIKKPDEKQVQESKPTRYHKIQIKGLKAYTRYQYVVECEGRMAEGSFLTAAPAKKPFRFAVYGDNRTQPAIHASVLARMAEYNPDFIIQTGDLVADGTNESQWSEFFRVAGKTLAGTPYYPALGNHEKDGAAYLRYFAVGREYSFNYGNIHFVGLDSNHKAPEFAAQEEWLRKDLAEHQKDTWRIVFFHHTLYTCVTKKGRREAAELLRARLEPIFLASKVQVVFNGHDHDYQHHLAKGIHYVVTGGGGAPLYEVKADTPFALKAKTAYHYCEAEVKGDVLKLLAREPNGSVIEQFSVHSN